MNRGSIPIAYNNVKLAGTTKKPVVKKKPVKGKKDGNKT